jgi:hypothetical protein
LSKTAARGILLKIKKKITMCVILFNRLMKYLKTDFYNPTIFTSPAQATKNGWLLAAGEQRSIVFYLCGLQLGLLAE